MWLDKVGGEMKAVINNIEVECTKCEEVIPSGETYWIHNDKPYCDCCVEDAQEEGRPL
jgi:formylmethanofuran dehydrogenase subunit E